MPLVTPLAVEDDEEVAKLAEFFNETLGYCPNSVLTMMRRPAIAKAFIELNMAVMKNDGRVTSALKRMVGYVASTQRAVATVRHTPFGQQSDMAPTQSSCRTSGSIGSTPHSTKRRGLHWTWLWRRRPFRMRSMTNCRDASEKAGMMERSLSCLVSSVFLVY